VELKAQVSIAPSGGALSHSCSGFSVPPSNSVSLVVWQMEEEQKLLANELGGVSGAGDAPVEVKIEGGEAIVVDPESEEYVRRKQRLRRRQHEKVRCPAGPWYDGRRRRDCPILPGQVCLGNLP
jgi:hypothetical protein